MVALSVIWSALVALVVVGVLVCVIALCVKHWEVTACILTVTLFLVAFITLPTI